MKTKRILFVAIAVFLIVTFAIVAFVACDMHKHTFSQEWVGDETYHWHPATCEHTDEMGNKAEHSFDSNGKCSVCNSYGTQGVEYSDSDFYQGSEVIGFGNLTSSDIVILDYYKGKPVTAIGHDAFYKCTDLTSITIPSSVTSILWNAFQYSTIPTILFGNVGANPVTETGCHFYMIQNGEWQEVTKIEIPEGVTEIKSWQYRGFKYVTSIAIPNTVTSIGKYAFAYCSSLQTITFESDSQLQSIGDRAFCNCRSLTSITIPSTVTYIGETAFGWCTDLQTVTFHDDSQLQSIGDGAFYDCDSLTNVYYGGTIESWCGIEFDFSGNPLCNGGHLFMKQDGDWQEVTELVIPEGVEKIGNHQFDGFENITSITISSKVTSIGAYAFYNCSSLTSVTIPSAVTSIGIRAFEYCTNLQTVTFEGDIQLQNIGDWAFYNCRGLTSITIPSTLTSINYSAFCWCVNLQTVTFEDDSQLQSIAEDAFHGCSSLTSIVIPNTVTSIGEYAFCVCTNLQTVTFESDSQLQSIGELAFDRCTSLTSITIPSTVTSIGNSAFWGCSSLQMVTFEADSQLQNIDYEAFYCCSSLQTVTFEGDSQLQSIAEDAFHGCSSLQEITIPTSVASIGVGAFGDCDALKSVIFENPNGWKADGDSLVLTDPEENAIYLTSVYDDAGWTRTE